MFVLVDDVHDAESAADKAREKDTIDGQAHDHLQVQPELQVLPQVPVWLEGDGHRADQGLHDRVQEDGNRPLVVLRWRAPYAA